MSKELKETNLILGKIYKLKSRNATKMFMAYQKLYLEYKCVYLPSIKSLTVPELSNKEYELINVDRRVSFMNYSMIVQDGDLYVSRKGHKILCTKDITSMDDKLSLFVIYAVYSRFRWTVSPRRSHDIKELDRLFTKYIK